jgi:ATP-dependent RNA circularization protein (DNA/RNA ligase family)
MAFKYNVEAVLKDMFTLRPDLQYVCIQGESVGSVQGNPLKLAEDDFYAFNFIDSDRGRWPSNEGAELLDKYGIKWVPILDTNFMMPDDMETFKQMATAKSVVNPAVMREGIVLRDPTTDFSFKNVSREYLLKHE